MPVQLQLITVELMQLSMVDHVRVTNAFTLLYCISNMHLTKRWCRLWGMCIGLSVENFGVLWLWGFRGDSHRFFFCGMRWVWRLKSNLHGCPAITRPTVNQETSHIIVSGPPANVNFVSKVDNDYTRFVEYRMITLNTYLIFQGYDIPDG